MNKSKSTITHSKAAELLSLLGVTCPAGETLNVDKVVRLQGTITKGEDYKADATCKALSLITVGCILRHCGITREFAIAAAIKAIWEAQDYTLGNKPDARDKEFAEEFKRAVAKELPQTQCDGKRTGSLLVEDCTPAAIQGHQSIDVCSNPTAPILAEPWHGQG